MKSFKYLFTPFFIALSFITIGQSRHSKFEDSLVTNGLQRSIQPPSPGFCDTCYATGISLLRIYKIIDTVKINCIWSSGDGYDLANQNGIFKYLNSIKFNQHLQNGYNILVPIYFFYQDKILHAPNKYQVKYLTNKLKKLRREIFILKQIDCISYGTVR